MERVLWRVGQKYRANGPNPDRGGRWEPSTVQVLKVDELTERYTVKLISGAQLYGGTITFEAGAACWHLVEDAPAETLA